MKTHDFQQGSPEWLTHRAQHFNASDAPAMLGCSPYMTRTELLARMKTGITQEVDAGTQQRFDDGHRFEALARPLAEEIIGEDLYPITGSEGELSASFDGLTFLQDTVFEHKTLNDELRRVIPEGDLGIGDSEVGGALPLQYRVQMEQQLMVSGAERALFMATTWSSGDSLVEQRQCWYESDPILRAQIVAGWKQFAADLVNYVPEAKAAPVVAAPVETLPSVSVKVEGALAIVSNLPDFGEALRRFIDKIPAQPNTDQEFADTEAACKALKRAEDALDAAETNALAQLSDVDTMRRFVADFKALARTTRLQKEKLVAHRKEAMKGEIVASGVAALAKHIRELNAAMPAPYMPQIPADFGGCIKGLRTIDSITNAVDTELARCKIAAADMANRIHTNIAALRDAGVGMPPDLATLVIKASDDFAAVIAQRKAAEQARLEAQREQIRAEEAAKLQREAEAKAAAEKAEAERLEREAEAARKVREAAEEMARKSEQEEADRLERQRQAVADAAAMTKLTAVPEADSQIVTATPAPAPAVQTVSPFHAGNPTFTNSPDFGVATIDSEQSGTNESGPSHLAPKPAPGLEFDSRGVLVPIEDDGARLTLTQLNAAISPVSIDVAGLATLGFEPVEKVKASRLFRACDLPAICAAISAHVLRACAPVEA